MKKDKIISILALIPLTVVIVVVYLLKVDVPFWDQWELIPILSKFYSGNLTFFDLWLPHNEHRILFPKILMVILAHITHWDTTIELYINILLAIGIYITLIVAATKVFRKMGIESKWYLPLFSLVIFSLNQFENWIFGWQMQIFLCVFSVIMGFGFLTSNNLNFKKYLASIALGIIASFSFANGLIYWPVGLLGLHMNSNVSKTYFTWMKIVWIGMSVMVYMVYFYHFTATAEYLKIGEGLNISEFILYVLLYLGRPLGVVFYNHQIYSIIFGIFGMFFYIASILFIFLKDKLIFKKIRFFLLISLYTIGSALVTGIGRANYGYEQAHSSRYITITNLFWVTNIILFILISKKMKKRNDSLSKNFLILSPFIKAVFIFFIIVSSIRSITEFQIYHNRLIDGRITLLQNKGYQDRKSVYYDDRKMDERIAILKQYKLSLFRE